MAAGSALHYFSSNTRTTRVMAATRPALYTPGCSHCRSLVFNLFAGHQPQHAPVIRSLYSVRPQAVRPLFIRRFSSFPKPSNSLSGADHGQESSPASESEKGGDSISQESRTTDIPWYLQVEPPTHIATVEPVPLLEVPPDAPLFIGTLLKYVSEDMGLDALSLLDLRKLDPPPALGPNLFMLFGTARSERHLNVSAGRLVRWLRAKHRIHADADGLLGPNERKTKLRRKARRAKLLGTMGTDEGDDGIRTGWICVNLGTVDRGGLESPVVAEDGRVSGFGVSQSGSTVVIQIMTESRRAEMELEILWTDALERSISAPPGPTTAQGKTSKGDKQPKKNLHPVEKTMLAHLRRPSPLPDGRKSRSSGTPAPHQVRFYAAWSQAGVHLPEVDPLTLSSPEALQRVLTYDPQQKYRVLELLRTHLDNMEAQEASDSLNKRPPGLLRPPFVELMELAMGTLPPHRTWEYRLALRHKICVSNFPDPRSLEKAQYLVTELRLYGIQATREQYLQLLSCIFYSGEEKQQLVVELALEVITTMHQRNQTVLASDVIVTMLEGPKKKRNPWTVMLAGRLEPLLYQPNAPCMDEPLLMRLITVFGKQNHWKGIWRAWRHPPMYLRRRSPDMYAHLFRTIAATGSQALCALVLRRCTPEMMSEEPPVLPVGHVRQAILACIRLVDRDAERHAKQLAVESESHRHRAGGREFVKLARMILSTDR